GNAMLDNWHLYGNTLQRLSLAEIQPRIENAIKQVIWNKPADANEAAAQDIEATIAFQRAGLKMPGWERLQRQQEFQQSEIKAQQGAQEAAHKAMWGGDED